MRFTLALAALMVASPAMASAAPLVLAQEQGGGIGGSLEAPEAQPRPSRAAPRAITRPEGTAEARYSFPINTAPDGWAALKAEPWGSLARLTKVYDGTLFLVVGAMPGLKLVQFKSGERGWIAERLVGCCRPASH
jgi:hypothetical protein